jgi:hypothetical protein
MMPTQEQVLRPILEVAAEGGTQSMAEIEQAVADRLGLDGETRSQRVASGGTVLGHRIGWARTSLVKAGLVDQPGPSAITITEAGRGLLEATSGELDYELLRQRHAGFAIWLADMGQIAESDLPVSDEATVWMLRAGRNGRYAATFVDSSYAVVGWGQTGDVSTFSREQLEKAVAACWPDGKASQRGQAVNTLYRLVHTMAVGDLVITPEPESRTLLLGRVSGPYRYLDDPPGEGYRHARPVKWFARVSRDLLSYGARNSLGALMTLSRPSHAGELRQLAAAHADDPPPDPIAVQVKAAVSTVPVRVPVPSTAAVAKPASVSDFQTHSMSMLQLVDQLESGLLALPDFQRSFVWAPDATRELIVSIIRSFPAGALLFLQGGSTFKARAVEAAGTLSIQPSYLVLDGQQRLTSLYQALAGVGQSRFFLDVGALISGSEVDDAVRVLAADRAAHLASRQAQADALVMPLEAVRDGGMARWRDEVIALRDEEDPDHLRNLLYGIENTYLMPLRQYRFPVTVLPDSTALEAVCTIFETLNRTGKPLTPFELISARAFAGGLSLYDYWSAARAQYPILDDFDIEPYYLLQVVALRLGRSPKRSSVLALTADEIETSWSNAVVDMAAAIKLLRDECGVLVSKWLPYRPMLIPLASAWRVVADASGPDQGAMRTKLKQWFWCASFSGEYDSSSVTLAERDAPALREWLAGGEAPPVVSHPGWDAERWRSVTVRQQGLYRATIALTLTGHPRDFHTAAPLTQDVIEAGKVDDHHVFPRGYLKDVGLGGEVDSVLNHVLIDRATNISIGKKAPSVYLEEIRKTLGAELDAVLASHHLPTGEDSYLANDAFEPFLTWRLERLIDLLQARVGKLTAPARTVDPQLAKLDTRIEGTELELRELIVARLENDPARLPSHLAQKAQERRDAAARREPGGQHTGVADLEASLEYLDLRDLQGVLSSKVTWPAFAPTFATKEALDARFSQLSELRNSIRHSRTTSAIVLKDGEAALLWFEQALGAVELEVADSQDAISG